MEGWKNLTIRQFDNGRLEDWKNGRMEEWKNLVIRQFDNGRMEDWKDGKMEGWKNLAIWQFDNTTMEEWKIDKKLPAANFFLTPNALCHTLFFHCLLATGAC